MKFPTTTTFGDSTSGLGPRITGSSLYQSLLRLSTLLFISIFIVGHVSANTPLTDEFVQEDLANNHGYKIALASRPMFHFGQSRGNPPCYPSTALDTLTRLPHGVPPTPWPDASTGCPSPGPALGLKGPSFPTYYTATQCSPTHLRIVYSIYFQRDGWSNVLIAKGHMHDWERVIVLWDRRASPNNVNELVWTRTAILTSHHSGYDLVPWGDIQNTFYFDRHDVNGGRDGDGVKVYVGWGKHAMYLDRNTGWNDPASQGCSREFRSRDWWWMAEDVEEEEGEAGRREAMGGLVWAGNGSVLAAEIGGVEWGSAGSTPGRVEERVCGEEEGGYVVCGFEELK